jgi:5-methylcytosine-specific restriction protein A
VSRKTPHLCAEPFCPNVVDGPGRCPEHRHGRARSGSDGYGAKWRKVRDAYLREHPACEGCGSSGPWLDVHHRDGRSPLEPGANDWHNLQTLCRSCHRRVTERAKQEARSRARV